MLIVWVAHRETFHYDLLTWVRFSIYRNVIDAGSHFIEKGHSLSAEFILKFENV